MFDKLVKNESVMRFVILLLIGSILILTLNVLTSGKDSRRQIADLDGGSEERLCMVLSGISGAGDVDIMLDFDNEGKVRGAIITASGGADPVVANNLTKAVTTLYGIPVSSVIVFEKEQEE